MAALAALAMLPALCNAQDNVEIVSADTATVDIDVANPLDNQPGLYGSEMIAEKMPVAEVHASTIVEIEGGLATASRGEATLDFNDRGRVHLGDRHFLGDHLAAIEAGLVVEWVGHVDVHRRRVCADDFHVVLSVAQGRQHRQRGKGGQALGQG